MAFFVVVVLKIIYINATFEVGVTYIVKIAATLIFVIVISSVDAIIGLVKSKQLKKKKKKSCTLLSKSSLNWYFITEDIYLSTLF